MKFWKWLKTFFVSHTADSYDFYHPGQRKIYRYFDGQKEVNVDPLLLYRTMMAVGPELQIDYKVSRSPSKDASKAHEEMLAKLRNIFQVKSLNEGGLTESELVDLWDHFLIYTETVKKNSRESVMSSKPTVVSSDISAKPPATSSFSDSGLTVKESVSAEPQPLPLETPLHLG